MLVIRSRSQYGSKVKQPSRFGCVKLFDDISPGNMLGTKN